MQTEVIDTDQSGFETQLLGAEEVTEEPEEEEEEEEEEPEEPPREGVLRTPNERFVGLTGYPYQPKYVTVGDQLRMHYVDEGDKKSWPVLMLHGEPSWSYLYRDMIRIFAEAGFRAVAPDLIGFGRSDKPARREDYTYDLHVAWMRDFIKELDLKDITLVCQDWGGLIGLRLAAEMPERFARIVAANTFLPTGETEPSQAFLAWRNLSQTAEELSVSRVIRSGVSEPLSDAACRAYDAPFPDESFKAGVRSFPVLVPTEASDPACEVNRAAWTKLTDSKIPFLTAFSDGDAVTRGLEQPFQERLPGAADREHPTIVGAGHFLQEDRGPELAHAVLDFFDESSPAS